jgi:hypothetical protein
VSGACVALALLPACGSFGGGSVCPPRPTAGPGVSRVDLGARVVAVAAGDGALWAIRQHGERGLSDVIQVGSSGAPAGRAVPLPGFGTRLAVGAGSVWVSTQNLDRRGTAIGPSMLLRIDPTSHRILARPDVGEEASGLAVGEGGAWVSDASAGVLRRIDLVTDRVVASVHIDGDPEDVRTGAGAVWVRTQQHGERIHRIDPATNRETGTLDLSLENVGLGGVWASDGALRRVDPLNLRVTGPSFGFDILPASVAIAGDQLWVGKWQFYCSRHNPDPEGPPITSFVWFRMDPSTLRALSGPVFVGSNLGTPVYAAGALWLAPDTDSRLIRIDLRTAGSVAPTPTPGLPVPATHG